MSVCVCVCVEGEGGGVIGKLVSCTHPVFTPQAYGFI